ncbi:MAG: hypothetical protein IJS07_04170 [Bacteroidales bacterium]|nr:hypothetical protein [Bacteroidales bacterium]
MKELKESSRMEYVAPECESMIALEEGICGVSPTAGNEGWNIGDFEW